MRTPALLLSLGLAASFSWIVVACSSSDDSTPAVADSGNADSASTEDAAVDTDGAEGDATAANDASTDDASTDPDASQDDAGDPDLAKAWSDLIDDVYDRREAMELMEAELEKAVAESHPQDDQPEEDDVENPPNYNLK